MDLGREHVHQGREFASADSVTEVARGRLKKMSDEEAIGYMEDLNKLKNIVGM